MSPAEELARWFPEQGITGGFGGGDDWSTHVAREPMDPANVVTLYDVGGLNPDAGDLRRPQIQIRVRAVNYTDGNDLQETIRALLVQPNAELDSNAQLERTIGGGRYVTADQLGDILCIGRDERDRFLIVANYQLIRQALEES